MTDAQIFHGMAITTLRHDLHQFQALRFAEFAYRKHGPEFLERIADQFQLDDAGRLRPVGPATDRPMALAGSQAAGEFLATRYLG